MNVKVINEGEPIVVRLGRRVKESCCDCGLVHTMRYRLAAGGELVIEAWRDEATTKALRHQERHTHRERRSR